MSVLFIIFLEKFDKVNFLDSMVCLKKSYRIDKNVQI